jgi:hypothetical protein
MTASQSCRSARRAGCLSTGHGKVRPNIRLSSQIVRQLTEFDATRGSSSSRSTIQPLCWSVSTPFTHLIRRTQIPIAQAATPTSSSRGFLPWRFAYAGPQCTPRHRHGGRHPQTFTQAASRAFETAQMVARHRTNGSRKSDAVGGMAEDPSCLPVASAPVVNNLGTRECSSARRSLSNRSTYGRFEFG